MKTGYPEHEKLKAISAQSQACGEFLDWLSMKGWTLHSSKRGRFFNVTRELAEFFKINERKLEAEKQQMLEALRRSKE